jgi:uncharacterized membrane protein YphA (DoxX/SURF4 family)
VPHILFFTFPGGRAGVALLVLRVALGLTLLLRGWVDQNESVKFTVPWIGIAAAACGVLLIVGFLVTAVSVSLALVAVGGAFLRWPFAYVPADGTLPVWLAAAILIAIFLLGPGAISLDARLFGRREIIIPPHSSPE